MVPRPVKAVLLLFPITEATEAARKQGGGLTAADACPPTALPRRGQRGHVPSGSSACLPCCAAKPLPAEQQEIEARGQEVAPSLYYMKQVGRIA